MFSNTLLRHRFKKIMQFLRLDLKSNRRQGVIRDKVCFASSLHNLIIENCQKAYVRTWLITLLLTSNYFHVNLDAGLYNTCEINWICLESSSRWRLTRRQNIRSIAFHILGNITTGHFSKSAKIGCDKADTTDFQRWL